MKEGSYEESVIRSNDFCRFADLGRMRLKSKT